MDARSAPCRGTEKKKKQAGLGKGAVAFGQRSLLDAERHLALYREGDRGAAWAGLIALIASTTSASSAGHAAFRLRRGRFGAAPTPDLSTDPTTKPYG